MASGVRQDEAWLSDAFKTRLRSTALLTPENRWLIDLRLTIDDYEDLTHQEVSKKSTDLNFDKYIGKSDAFDNILKNLGNEIYELDSYQKRNSYQSTQRSGVSSEIEQNIMQIFDSCINDVKICDDDLSVCNVNRTPSYDSLSILSDEVLLKSANSSKSSSDVNLSVQSKHNEAISPKKNDFDINHIFYKGNGVPVPPKRKNRHFASNTDNIEAFIHKPKPISKMERFHAKLNVTNSIHSSDSGNNSPIGDNTSDYQNIWNCTSGSKNKHNKTHTLKENHGLINTISFDTVKDISNSTLDLSRQRFVVCRQSRVGKSNGSNTSINSVNSEGAVVDNFRPKSCVESKRYSYDSRKPIDKMVYAQDGDYVKCTSECDSTDECHRELSRQKIKPIPMIRKLIHQENIYENIQVLMSEHRICQSETDLRQPLSETNLKSSSAYPVDDDYNSSSVEIISDSDSWRTPIGQRRSTSTSTTDYASESPIYENVEDLRYLRPLTSDVIAWKALLLDPFWNDEEDDEWISAEEAAAYAKEQKPPYVLPRLKPYKQKPPTPNYRNSREFHHVDDEPKSPTIKEVRKKFEESLFNKNNFESPNFCRVPPRMGGSTEGLAVRMAYSPHETSPIEMRSHLHDTSSRNNKAKSLASTAERKEQKNYKSPQRVLPRPYDPNIMPVLNDVINRTKLTDNGKKVKKNWQTNYAVLTQMAIVFYKDKKAFQSAKSSPNSNISMEACVPLAGALVSEATPQQTKRINSIVITSTPHQQHTQQHILQHEDPFVIKHWFDSICKAINKLPSDYVCPDNTNIGSSHIGTPSPIQKRASGAKSSSKVPEGSMEDLSDTPEHVKVKSKLKKFFNRRPTMESLIKNGIYKDEPVFGRLLDQACLDTNHLVPEFVNRCIKAIEAAEENMKTDGLYRASGNLSQVQKIRLEVDQNNLSILEKDVDVHVLTGALKLFFRELKEPLIPFKCFQKILNASSNPHPESRTKEFRDIIHSFPDCNRQTLKYLLEHLIRVTSYKEHNRMHISNLAIVFGPTLLWAPMEAAHNMAIDCLQQNQVIEILLTDFDKLFKEEGKRK